MKEKKTIIEKISSGKGFYITAALSLTVIVTAIAFVYNSSVDMLKDLDIPTTIRQVEKNQTSVLDPRNNKESEAQSSTAAEKVTTTRPTTTAVTDESTTVTEPVEVFNNDVFTLPMTSDIDRKFTMTPVYDETMEDWRIHKGVDFLGQAGQEVASIGNGKVTKVIFDPTWGYCIEIDYGKFTARYCGLEQGTAVGIDAVVSKGDIVGKIGAIPCESKQESHLHFEIVRDGVWIDPTSIMGE